MTKKGRPWAPSDELEGDPATNRSRLLGLVDLAHAALADETEDAVGTNLLSPGEYPGARGPLRIEECTGPPVGGEQGLDLPSQVGVARAPLGEEARSVGLLHIQALLQEPLHELPSLGVHRAPLRLSSW
jgi:hypothetical protein